MYNFVDMDDLYTTSYRVGWPIYNLQCTGGIEVNHFL